MSILSLANELLFLIAEQLLVMTADEAVPNYLHERYLVSRRFPGNTIRESGELDIRSLASLLRTNRQLNVVLTPLLAKIMREEIDDLLLWASGIRNEMLARRFLDNGANVNTTDKWGATSLHRAAGNGDDQLVRLLLDRGASHTLENGEMRVPLHYAMFGGRAAVVKLLIENGADVNVQDKNHATPLFFAILRNDEEMVHLLVSEYGADITMTDDDLRTPLHQAAEYRGSSLVEFLLDNGAHIHQRSRAGLSALEVATSYGNDAAAKKLVGRGATVCGPNIDDALVEAVKGGSEYGVGLYLDNGAVLNPAPLYGRYTLLQLAIIHCRKRVMEVLLERGVDPDERGFLMQTALHVAAGRSFSPAISVLLEGGADIELPCERIGSESDPGPRPVEGGTALHIAARRAVISNIEVLLRHGANPNARDCRGRTPLHMVLESATTYWKRNGGLGCDAVKLLLDHGADINAKGYDGRTALHDAAWCALGFRDGRGITGWGDKRNAKWKQVITLLVERGIDVGAKDENGQTAVDLLAFRPRLQAITVAILDLV